MNGAIYCKSNKYPRICHEYAYLGSLMTPVTKLPTLAVLAELETIRKIAEVSNYVKWLMKLLCIEVLWSIYFTKFKGGSFVKQV